MIASVMSTTQCISPSLICARRVISIEANFMSPVLFPDEIVIDTSIIKTGTKSFTLMQRAVNERTEQVKCVCETVMVMMDTNTNVSVEIDSEFRRKVEEFEKD